eukprot:5339712-Pyramimonas_sp.AAC.1
MRVSTNERMHKWHEMRNARIRMAARINWADHTRENINLKCLNGATGSYSGASATMVLDRATFMHSNVRAYTHR